MQSHQRLIFPAAAAFVFIVAGLSLVRGFGGTMAAAPSPSERNPGDSKGAWDNAAAGRRLTASRSRPASCPEGGDEKALRTDRSAHRKAECSPGSFGTDRYRSRFAAEALAPGCCDVRRARMEFRRQ